MVIGEIGNWSYAVEQRGVIVWHSECPENKVSLQIALGHKEYDYEEKGQGYWRPLNHKDIDLLEALSKDLAEQGLY